jgi:hypothetical protein
MSRLSIILLAIIFAQGVSAQIPLKMKLETQNKTIIAPDSKINILSAEKKPFSLYQPVNLVSSAADIAGNLHYMFPVTVKSSYNPSNIPELHIDSDIIYVMNGPSPSGFRITQSLSRPFGKLTFNPAFTRNSYYYNFTGSPRLVNETFFSEIIRSALH